MRRMLSRLSAQAWLVGTLFVISSSALLFTNALIAKPKVLFGRSLSPIEPTLFPSIILTLLVLLCTIYLFTNRNRLLESSTSRNYASAFKTIRFFIILVVYAVTMIPFGFLISSAVAMSSIALIAGNRSLVQIFALSIISPITIYLVATRGLAVSLPELSPIEFAYAWILDR